MEILFLVFDHFLLPPPPTPPMIFLRIASKEGEKGDFQPTKWSAFWPLNDIPILELFF